jgi:DNA replicative helicase MCM subunit Mcm2 (Cdc46/Mcm family)
MIRLSEAIARAYCSEVIITSFVMKVYSLLNQSIVRVQMVDIELNEVIVKIPYFDNNFNHHETNMSVNKKTKIKYRKFMEVRNIFIQHLEACEQKMLEMWNNRKATLILN